MTPALIAFAALAAAIAYVLAGYPLLLLLRRRRPIRKQFTPRRVTVLLAVRNGEAWLEQKLRNLAALDYPRELIDIIVISDGSKDSTVAIAESWRERGVQLIVRAPEGKSAALTAGIEQASGEILFFTDVRQRLAPDSLRALVACFDDPSVGVVSGELMIAEGASTEESSVGLYWKYEKWIRARLSDIDSILGATGCIFAMRRELAVPIPSGVLLDDVYLPLAAFFRQYRCILESKARAFDQPSSLDVEFRRKVRTQAGVYQLLRYYPGLLGFGNRMWIDFVSHKLARLALPWLLLSILVVSAFLPGVWRGILAAQLAFYLIAALDGIVPEHTGLKRLTAPARTFVVLMAAAACAVSILFVPVDRLWKPTVLQKTSGNV